MTDRILIAGAGPVGLSLAVALARAGRDVDVFEAEPDLSTEMRASTIHASTMEMFDEWGVIDDVLARGRRAERLQYWERTTRTLVAELPYSLIAEDTRYPFRLQCPQSTVTRVLRAALERTGRGRVRTSNRVLSHRDLGDAVEVTVATPEGVRTARGAYLIGCDGAHSAVRAGLDLHLHGVTYVDRFLLIGSDIDFSRFFPGVGPVAYIYDPDEWAILMHLPDLVRTVFRLTEDEDEHAATRPDAVRARIANLVGERVDFDPRMASVYSVHQRVAETFRVGRVVLAGDAAHLNNPAGGMGMNSGIHDAHALAAALCAGTDAALDDYARARKRVAESLVQQASERNYRDLVLRGSAERRSRNEAMRRIAADPAAARTYLLKAAMLA